MSMNGWKKLLDSYGKVDAVDFVPIGFNPKLHKEPNTIYQTCRYEDLVYGDVSYPRSNWYPWRVIDGVKFYLDKEGNPIVVNSEYEWVEEADKEEYWGYWIKHTCGAETPAYAKFCCGCGKEIGWIHKETEAEYLRRNKRNE
jgi:hypothetical protein